MNKFIERIMETSLNDKGITNQTIRIIFYCKDCRKIVEGIKVGRKYVYRCALCNTKNVAFGTEKSIKNFYHVN